MILPALVSYIPDDMVQAIAAFLDFCYLIRRPVFTPEILDDVDAALKRYYGLREAFRDTLEKGIFSIKQHIISHYREQAEETGAPVGICMSITESKHIDAVKKPYRRSNRHNAIWQILLTNQRLDKLSAARADFTRRGMLSPDPQKSNATPYNSGPGNSHDNTNPSTALAEDDIDDLSRDRVVDDDNVNDAELLFDSPIGERPPLSRSRRAGASTNEMNRRPIRPPSDVRLAKRPCPGAFARCTYW